MTGYARVRRTVSDRLQRSTGAWLWSRWLAGPPPARHQQRQPGPSWTTNQQTTSSRRPLHFQTTLNRCSFHASMSWRSSADGWTL